MNFSSKNKNFKHITEPSSLKVWSQGHLVLAGCLSFSVLILFLLVPPTEVRADRSMSSASSIVQNRVTATSDLIADDSSRVGSGITSGFTFVEEQKKKQLDSIDWKTIEVESGDNLTLIFKRAGLTSKDTFELVGSGEQARQLSKLKPGNKIDFHIVEHKLENLRYRKNVLETQTFTRTKNSFAASTETRTPEKQVEFKQAVIQDSLFLAGQKAGLDQNVIMQLASVFGGVIDFILDPRKGDKFNIMYEDLYLNGEKIGNGKILAAEYTNQGDTFVAYRYEDKKGNAGYFAPDGVSMQKAFLRAPLDFKRISSSFNLRRVHPIHKRIRAHRGIDYVAPRGTPVFAAGDGRVSASGYSKANGNYVVIAHGPQYTTKYLHLTKRHVKRNGRIKKGEILGTVGSTGYSTGPHLHYEFLVNGVHRNPRTILNKLPKAKAIAKKELPRFNDQIAGLQMQLANHQLASLDLENFTLVEPENLANASH